MRSVFFIVGLLFHSAYSSIINNHSGVGSDNEEPNQSAVTPKVAYQDEHPPTTMTMEVPPEVTRVQGQRHSAPGGVELTTETLAGMTSGQDSRPLLVNILGVESALYGVKGSNHRGEEYGGTEEPDVTTELPDETTDVDMTTDEQPIYVPDPYEQYANRMWLEGHLDFSPPDMESILQTALWNANMFTDREPLAVHVIHSHFQVYQSAPVTEIHYVVTYNGHTLRTESVTGYLNHPSASVSLHKNLEERHMRQYQPPSHKLKKNHHESKLNMAAKIMAACAGGLLLLVIIAFIVRRRQSVKKPTKSFSKGPVVSADIKKQKLFQADDSPPPYSMENPAYAFETSSVMDGHTLP